MPDKPSKLMPSLYGGLIMGAISGLPVLGILNCFCCAGVLLGGFLSVLFYKNELTSTMSPLTNSDAMQLGVFAGLWGALFGTIFHVLTLATVGDVSSGMILNMLRNLNLPPDALEQMEEKMAEGGILSAALVVRHALVSVVIDVLFGLLGGLIGFSMFKPKQTMMNVPPPPPPVTPA